MCVLGGVGGWGGGCVRGFSWGWVCKVEWVCWVGVVTD
jgi:hypothetical protein